MDFQQELERYKRSRRILQRQIQWSRNVFLAILAVSLVNQVLLSLGIEYHLLFSAASPYYANWIALQLGGGWKLLSTVLTVGIYALGILCWYFFSNPRWTTTAFAFYAVDTVALAVMAAVLLSNPLSCLLELLVHCLALVLLYPACKAAIRLETLKQRLERRERESV